MASTTNTSKVFEAALRDAGVVRMRLPQVVTIYQKAFPSDAMRPDMRQRLHDAIIELVRAGAVTVPQGDGLIGEDPSSLPQALEIADPVDVHHA